MVVNDIFPSFIQRVDSAVPLGYTTPPFPSLYWPLPAGTTQSFYLYRPDDILRFTVYWTLLLVGGIHFITAIWACVVQWRNWKLIWIALPVFSFVGGVEALVAGAIVGGLLGGVYQAGYFEMSTWIPFVWAVINTLVLILSSFAIYGGL
ncbi:integral membrane protein [Alternaria alternata]|nr:integral membrane protein [Alternaria alternata]